VSIKHSVFTTFLMMALCVFAMHAEAKNCQLGKVIFVSGTPFLERNAQQLDLATDMVLCAEDKIITATDSIAEIEMRDGTKITVGKDSEFVIKKFQRSRKSNVAIFELLKGAFRAVTGSITKRPHRFEVKTVVATIGVRGTDFWGGFGLTENGLDVLMLEGKGVYVKNNLGETVELDQPGLGTTVLENTPPSAPKKWGDAKVAKAVATITP
jgi:hypothetical protein